uniref:Uncharacterized protein n=1 Tax=Anguilla anguilla TaxID=7936 RepID=A0A0E9XPM7_ANGAN
MGALKTSKRSDLKNCLTKCKLFRTDVTGSRLYNQRA